MIGASSHFVTSCCVRLVALCALVTCHAVVVHIVGIPVHPVVSSFVSAIDFCLAVIILLQWLSARDFSEF